jgi:excisionase family DNA binding protein
MSDPEWLTASEAAKILGVSRSTIHRYVEAGILPARRLPSRVLRIRRAEVERLAREADEREGG